MAVGLAEHMPLPRLDADWVDGDEVHAAFERRRLREVYEHEGWLPGPRPGRERRLRRRKALRRLGLTTGEHGQRQVVMMQYADMARRIFGTRGGYVGILFEDEEIIYPGEMDATPRSYSLGFTLCRHAVQSAQEQCMMVADLSRDWRHAKNPSMRDMDSKFFVLAPLRYHLHDDWVDFGCIAIHDTEPRAEFDTRQQELLLDLANMLVYQLTTLQSEISAKRLSTMYQDMISFLRRSIMPDSTVEKKIASEQGGPRRAAESAGRSHPAAHKVVKTGPKESMALKRMVLQYDRELFTDAAATLRGLLQADTVAVISAVDYHLYVRRSGPDIPLRRKSESKEKLVADLLAGKSWPANVEPVIVHQPRAHDGGLQVLGHAGESDMRLQRAEARDVISACIQSFFKHKRYWYAQDDDDELSPRLMSVMPANTHTAMALCWLNYDGALKFIMLVSWGQPPVMFGNAAKALPFAWIVAGLTACALAVRSIRNIEQSQITYSNIQAHELRTPMHQIIATTQLLRSTMTEFANMPSPQQLGLQQVRDLLPYLDAIDTSGNVLSGIVDNILSFLDLRGKEGLQHGSAPNLISSPGGPAQSLEAMLEEVLLQAVEEDKKARQATGRPRSDIETVFEIIPPFLGEEVAEDSGGAFRRAMVKLLSNAYKFIDDVGCVEIYVDYVGDFKPPEDCEEVSAMKTVSVRILDTGRGMDEDFLLNKLGEPWAKGDTFVTGSGLSVHLAWRIIDLMGGHMEISSAPGKGTMVSIEVPLPRRELSMPSSPGKAPHTGNDLRNYIHHPRTVHAGRKIAFVGFDTPGNCPWGLPRVGFALRRQYRKLGCEVTSDLQEADLVIVDGRREEMADFSDVLRLIRTQDIVILVNEDHEAHAGVLATEKKTDKRVRRYRKPATSAVLRESLLPGSSNLVHASVPTDEGWKEVTTRAPDELGPHGEPETSGSATNDDVAAARGAGRRASQVRRSSFSGGERIPGVSADVNWKPNGMSVEEAIASLSLGTYPRMRRRSTGSSDLSDPSPSKSPAGPTSGDMMTRVDTSVLGAREVPSAPPGGESPLPDVIDAAAANDDGGSERLSVLVVEDNLINRKILVKLLAREEGVLVQEAGDGYAALELFRKLDAPTIVLLDINMPEMDGYQVAQEMRQIELASGRPRSAIIAVTALGSEAERKRGLVECGMDTWLTKPCGKATITKAVEDADRKSVV